MRALSKQRLSRMHALLDKQLQNDQQIIGNSSPVEQKKKQKNDFHHLRYTSNIDLDDDQNLQVQKPKDQSRQKSSLFRKSLEKSQKAKQDSNQGRKKYEDLSSSQQSDTLQKETTNSLRGSRKNEINQLERKLLDLEKKMENIHISSSEEEDEFHRNKRDDKVTQKTTGNMLSKIDSKKSLNLLMLQQNNIETKMNQQLQSSSRNQGTARFSGVSKNQQETKRQKIDFNPNLPLSHRQNIQQRDEQINSDEDFEVKYEKFVKMSKGNVKQPIKQQPKQKIESSEEEDSSEEIQRNKFHTKTITGQISRLSIMKDDSIKVENRKQSIQNVSLSKVQLSSDKNLKAKVNTFGAVPDRKTTVEHESLQPKYPLDSRNKSISKSKKSVVIPKNSLSKEKVLPTRNSKPEIRQKSVSRKKPQRHHTNLDNSFRSENSAKSKKSINSLRSVGSNKSLNSKQTKQKQNQKQQNLWQKKYLKKIENLQKQLQHYKRLSKRYETQMSDYKLMEIQYRKLESQFKKSQQIRIEQKKIIQNFRNKMSNV